MELLCCSLKNPIGVDCTPAFTWKAEGKGYVQAQYRIVVREHDGAVWDSGTVQSDVSVAVAYAGPPLKSNTRYEWSVCAEGENGEKQSGSAFFETGLLSQDDWQGLWIGMGKAYRTGWGIMLRKEADIRDGIRQAKAFICGLGYYEFTINGRRVGDHRLDTAQTEYTEKILYATYDVTDMLQTGRNCFGILLGDGWYHQAQLMEGKGIYGDPCARLQLEITYQNGERRQVVSDLSWKADYAPVIQNNVYIGETYDARLEQDGWDTVGFDDSAWLPVFEETTPKGVMVSQMLPPIRVVKELPAIAKTMPQKGVYVYDLGENFAGIVHLHVYGVPGNVVVLRFAESLDETGMIDVASSGVFHIRGVQTLRYIFGKKGEIDYEQKFTYHGFRYVEVTGTAGEPGMDAVIGLKMNTDLEQTGYFSCDMPVLNTLHRLFCNAFTSNAYGLPTDCPAREKCGWTGDANIIADTAMTVFDTALFWDKYIGDTEDSHKAYGIWQNVMPGKRGCYDTVPAWGCAMITIPWYAYSTYGDESVLKRHYAQMKDYHAYMLAHTDNLIYEKHFFPLADWTPPYNYDSAVDFQLTSTAYLYFSTLLVEQAARVLHDGRTGQEMAALAPKLKRAIIDTYYDKTNHTYGTQTLNCFCIELGLFEDDEDIAMARWCADDIAAHDGHLTCGHIGIRYIFPMLTKYGYHELIKTVFEKDDYPSFGLWLRHGATTLYESWKTHNLSSYNHHFKGGFVRWMYTDVLGIQNTGIGYKTFTVRPLLTDIIPCAEGSLNTVHGTIKVAFRLGEYFRVEVPANTKAEVFVPQPDGTYREYSLQSGSYELS